MVQLGALLCVGCDGSGGSVGVDGGWLLVGILKVKGMNGNVGLVVCRW